MTDRPICPQCKRPMGVPDGCYDDADYYGDPSCAQTQIDTLTSALKALVDYLRIGAYEVPPSLEVVIRRAEGVLK